MDRELYGAKDALERGMDKVDLSRFLTPEQRARLDTNSEAELKVHVNSLATQFIPEIWELVSTYIEQNPPGLIGNDQKSESEQKFLALISKKQAYEIPDLIDDHTRPMFKVMSDEWEKGKKIALAKVKTRSDVVDDVFDYYSFREFLLRYRQFEAPDPATFIYQGLGTEISSIRGILKVIPEVYRLQNNGKEIDAKTLEEIAQNSLPMLNFLASFHLEIFTKIREKITAPKDSDEFKYFHYHPQYFTIGSYGPNPALKFIPEFMEGIRHDGTIETPITECPAKQTKVIKEVFLWYMTLAKKFYFPRFSQEK